MAHKETKAFLNIWVVKLFFGFVAATGATLHTQPDTWELLVVRVRGNSRAQWCKAPNSPTQEGFPTNSPSDHTQTFE